MSTSPKFPPITVEQYLGFQSPEGFRDELIEGEIVVSPEAKPLHHDVALNIYALLRPLCEPQFKVGMRINFKMPARNSMPSPDVWVIDANVWEEARDNDTYPVNSPILAVEVISPANRKARVEQKVGLYLDGGALQVWNVYPRKQEVVVQQPGSAALRLASEAGARLILPAPLFGEIDVPMIFDLSRRDPVKNPG